MSMSNLVAAQNEQLHVVALNR